MATTHALDKIYRIEAVVSTLAFYSNDTNSKPAEVYKFYWVKSCSKNKQK